MNWIATLPMYNVTPALADDWRALLRDVLSRVEPDTRVIEASDDLHALWRNPDLLLSQTCGYPLTHGLRDSGVQLVATPHFDVEGYSGAHYSSALVTHVDAPFDTLDAMRGTRAAYNQDDSHSGMNALRHAISPLAHDGCFFSALVRTGSHLGSLRAIAEHRADVAAIDCVTLAYVREHLPELARAIRTLGFTRCAPGLPLIASANVPATMIDALRTALNDAITSDAQRAQRLKLKRFSQLTPKDYDAIVEMEREAQAVGYPHLA